MSDMNTNKTISGVFVTRGEADRAVEHLVQQLGLERGDIVVGPSQAASSAGNQPSGGDVATGKSEQPSGDLPLNGSLVVSVKLASDRDDEVANALRDQGAGQISRG